MGFVVFVVCRNCVAGICSLICLSVTSPRERIRQGLEDLYMVRPGGDTFMHEGIQRVSRHLPPEPDFYLQNLAPEQAENGAKMTPVSVCICV